MTTNTDTTNKDLIIHEARMILNGKVESKEKLDLLIGELETIEQFSYAADILFTKINLTEEKGEVPSLKDYQKLACFIYKDYSLPSEFKFEKALSELRLHGEPGGIPSCETYGLMGAIYKRKWQFDNKFSNLEISEHYYKKGYDCWKKFLTSATDEKIKNPNLNDDGYTAINYAYVCELMAIVRLKKVGDVLDLTESTVQSIKEADSVRRFIIEQFVSRPFETESSLLEVNTPDWAVASVAEAYFGLRKYDQASKFVKIYFSKKKKEILQKQKAHLSEDEILSWKIKTFIQQLFSIQGLQKDLQQFISANESEIPVGSELRKINSELNSKECSDCLKTIKFCLNDKSDPETTTGIDELYGEGKLGLAMSGGGFRAALFHIGVLAAMAEHDKLKDVEVISCVSGGSIIGAFYYLKLKELLESKSDDQIKKSDYVAIVKEIETKFISGVQKNLRMRIFKNFVCNVNMFDKSYSRTHRLGELYEEHLYKPLVREIKKNSEKNSIAGKKTGPASREKEDARATEIYMTDLFIKPLDTPENFSIAVHNWSRKNKVPQLILNATSVNTGHNWQFTASWMGEPPGTINDDIDVKQRLRRMYYKDAPDPYKNFRLGYAVASSSCVPVMFEPMQMPDLYPGINLQLIDGGLNDNQGIASLIEQECKQMIISDASGQLPSSSESTGNEFSLFFRADNILQERLREIQFIDLGKRYESSQISALLKVHLKSGLKTRPVNWKNCEDPARKLVYEKVLTAESNLTSYGILRTVQNALSEIRTDLDSFNDIESYALMYSGYTQTLQELDTLPGKSKDASEEQWKFLQIKEYLTVPEKATEIIPVLKAGKKLAFKLIDLSKPLNYALKAFRIIAILGILWLVYFFWTAKIEITPIQMGALFTTLILAVIGHYFKWLDSFINYKTTLRKFLIAASSVFLGFLVCNFYIIILNPYYNRLGKLKNRNTK